MRTRLLHDAALAATTLTEATGLGLGDVFATHLDGQRTHVYVTGPAQPVTDPHGYARFQFPVRRLDTDAEAVVPFGPGGVVMKAALRVIPAPAPTAPQPLTVTTLVGAR